MPATYEPLASQTLGSATSSVTFSSISGTYTDLVVVASVQQSVDTGLLMRFNGDTGSNFSMTKVMGANGGGAFSTRQSSQTSINVGPWEVSVSTSGEFGILRANVMSYTNTNVNKTVLCDWANVRSSGFAEVNRTVGLWRSTSAITSLSLFPITGNFNSGCTFSLFGVKAA